MRKLQSTQSDISCLMNRDLKVSKSLMAARADDASLFGREPSALPRYSFRCDHDKFVRFLLLNPVIDTILNRMPQLNINDWWLSSGCLFQTIWNLKAGRLVTEGISDYDVIYFGRNLSWEAENEIIGQCHSVFKDLSVDIEIRNQARVHLWYKDKYGITYSPLKNATHSLWRYPSRTSAIAITKDGDNSYRLAAPFGIDHALSMRVEPNRRAGIRDVYKSKAERWLEEWPSLKVCNWD